MGVDDTTHGRRWLARLLVVTMGPCLGGKLGRRDVQGGLWGTALLLGLTGLVLCACKREESGPQRVESQPPEAIETVPAQPTEADIMAAQRTLDFVQGLLARKEYEQARQALAELQGRPMSPAQRQLVEHLKAQLPAAAGR